jgi:hypothetical protein
MALMPVDNDPFASPEDAFAYGKGISPDATWRNLLPAAELGLGLAPGSGEAMSARDAWDASGRAGAALTEGNFGDAASEYLNMGTGLLGAIPGAGIVARGTKRGAAWMDRNLPEGFNRLLDSVYPSDPRSTTNIFAGPTAKTADHAALAKAQEMKAQGASRADIWRETGWDLEKSDQIPRFEIDDSTSYVKPGAMERSTDDSVQFRSFLNHPKFTKAYPEARKWNVESYPDEEHAKWLPRAKAMILNSDVDDDTARWVSLHEGQHGVQDIEIFAQGGSGSQFSPRDVANEQKRLMALTPSDEQARGFLYHRLAGEVEARNVQSRMNMTAAERRAIPPWETQDVPDDQQIVRFGNQGPAHSAPVGGPSVSLQMVEDGTDGYKTLHLVQDGKTIGKIQAHLDETGDLFINDMAGFDGSKWTDFDALSNKVGTRGMLQVRKELQTMFPDIKTFSGDRVGGARADQMPYVKVKAK